MEFLLLLGRVEVFLKQSASGVKKSQISAIKSKQTEKQKHVKLHYLTQHYPDHSCIHHWHISQEDVNLSNHVHSQPEKANCQPFRWYRANFHAHFLDH